jgi:hypothetical protein
MCVCVCVRGQRKGARTFDGGAELAVKLVGDVGPEALQQCTVRQLGPTVTVSLRTNTVAPSLARTHTHTHTHPPTHLADGLDEGDAGGWVALARQHAFEYVHLPVPHPTAVSCLSCHIATSLPPPLPPPTLTH